MITLNRFLSLEEFVRGTIRGGILGGAICLGAWINIWTEEKQVTKLQDPFIYSHITLEKALESQGSMVISSISLGDVLWKINIYTNEYLQFKVQNHSPKEIKDYVKYVTYQHPQIIAIAEKITENCKTSEEKASKILDFVHQYVYDKRIEKDGNYVRFPLETIVEGNGDCEDLSILGAALMKAVGIDVALVYIPNPEKDKPSHIALGVVGYFKGSHYELKNGKKYFFAETTGTDWRNKPSTWKIGQLPENYKTRTASIYVVE